MLKCERAFVVEGKSMAEDATRERVKWFDASCGDNSSYRLCCVV
jgi:hypothetical protein